MKINKGEVKMKSSKIIAIFIISLLFLSVTVLANENYEISYENHYELNKQIHDEGINVENEELFNYLVEQSKAHNELINVLDYNIPMTDAKAVITQFFLNEDVYYISSLAVESYEGDYLKEIRPTYIYSQDEINEYERNLEEVTNEYLSGIKDEWTDLEKVIYTNIFICKKAEFGNQNDYSTHTIIGTLLDKSAVSDGYSKTFKYLLKKVNVNSTIVTSVMNECSWNMFEIDGIYYHADCANNDIPGYGKIMYEFIMKSDSYMMDYGFEWTADFVSEPKEEYDADWLYADTYLEYKDGYWYFLLNNLDFIEIDRYDFVNNEITYGTPIDGIVQEPLTWTPGFTTDGEKLYVSTNKEIYIVDYNFDTEEATYEKYFSLEGEKLIYSIAYLDGKMYYDTTEIDENGFTSEDTKVTNVYVKLLDITSDETEITIDKASIYNLKLVKDPIDATANIEWISLDENIVIVDENGTIQAINSGTTQVKAIFEDKEVVYTITVNEGEEPLPPDPPEDLEITTLNVEDVGEYKTITFDVKTTIDSIINTDNFPVLKDTSYTITILDQNGNLKEDWSTNFIGSKNTILVKKGEETVAEFKAIVKGDVTGNGILRMFDALQMLKDLVASVSLDDLDTIIRDHSTSGDNAVKMYDILQFLKEAVMA